MSNQVLTMDIILERENDMILEHCKEVTRPAPALVEGPHGGKHDARTAARLWREFEMCLWSGSTPAMFGGGWRR